MFQEGNLMRVKSAFTQLVMERLLQMVTSEALIIRIVSLRGKIRVRDIPVTQQRCATKLYQIL
jgi:expansin (peptidoglycan-binding protein)